MTPKSSISFEGCLNTALWNAAYVRMLWPTSILSCKFKHHHYRLEHLNETSYKLWKCMNQKCSAIVKHIIKCFSCLPLSLTYVFSLNRHWSISFDQWPSAVCLTNHHSNVASTHQHLTQNFNRPTPIALPRLCNLATKVWNVGKSEGRCYNWSPLSRDKAAGGCVCMLCWPAVLIKPKLVLHL